MTRPAQTHGEMIVQRGNLFFQQTPNGELLIAVSTMEAAVAKMERNSEAANRKHMPTGFGGPLININAMDPLDPVHATSWKYDEQEIYHLDIRDEEDVRGHTKRDWENW